MNSVDDVLSVIDELNPQEWRELDYDAKKRQLTELNAVLMTIESVIAALDRRIREFEASDEFGTYQRWLADKETLEKTFARVTKAATQLQTILRLP